MPSRPRLTRYNQLQREHNAPDEVQRRRSDWENRADAPVADLPAARTRDRAAVSDNLDERAIDSIEQSIRIDQNRLEECCTQHPDLIYRVAKSVALLRSRRDQAKWELEQAEARAYNRERDRVPDGERITEGALKARVVLDRDVTQLTQHLLDAGARLVTWEALKEAVSQRSYMLRELVELYLARYYTGDPARSAENRMREHATERVREARAESGRQGFNRRQE